MNLSYLYCIIWCVFCSTFTSATNSSDGDPDGKIPLYFAYITTFTGGFIASGGIPIVDMALQQINSRDDVLTNYTLGYIEILDSGVSWCMSHHHREDHIISVCCLCKGIMLELKHYIYIYETFIWLYIIYTYNSALAMLYFHKHHITLAIRIFSRSSNKFIMKAYWR